MTDDLHARLAEAIDSTYTTVKVFDAETAADAVLAVVQPELDRRDRYEDQLRGMRAWYRDSWRSAARERDRYRLAWQSARRRAAEHQSAGARVPGGPIREALVMAGYINRRDAVATAVEKIDASPRKWYASWLVNSLTRITYAQAKTVEQAKAQTRRAEKAEAAIARVRGHCELLADASCRVAARETAQDVLALFDGAMGALPANPHQVREALYNQHAQAVVAREIPEQAMQTLDTRTTEGP